MKRSRQNAWSPEKVKRRDGYNDHNHQKHDECGCVAVVNSDAVIRHNINNNYLYGKVQEVSSIRTTAREASPRKISSVCKWFGKSFVSRSFAIERFNNPDRVVLRPVIIQAVREERSLPPVLAFHKTLHPASPQ